MYMGITHVLLIQHCHATFLCLVTVRMPAGEIEFDCNHWSVFENAIDMAHIHYLHSDSFGNQESPKIRDMTCTHNAYGVKASFGLHNKPVNKLWEFSQVQLLLMLVCCSAVTPFWIESLLHALLRFSHQEPCVFCADMHLNA